MNNHLFLQRRERLMDLKNLRENKSTRRAVKAVAGKCPGCSAAVPAVCLSPVRPAPHHRRLSAPLPAPGSGLLPGAG